MATKTIKKIELNKVKSAAKNINQFVLDTTELIVDETLVRTSDWQNLADKAIKGGLKLSERQSDLTFKALETIKKTWLKSREDFKSKSN